LSVSLTTTGGDVRVEFQATGDTDQPITTHVDFKLQVDGVDAVPPTQTGYATVATDPRSVGFGAVISGLPAGLHTFSVQWGLPGLLPGAADARIRPVFTTSDGASLFAYEL
jgi:hypothetical protein